MTEEIKSAEQTQEAELSKGETTAEQSLDVDYESLYKAQAEKTAKAEEEARNLRKGYEKWKGIAKRFEHEEQPDESTDSSDMSSIVQKEVQRALAESVAVQEKQKLEELNLKMARELKEAKLALKNRSQTSLTAQGTGVSSIEVQDRYLSPELIADFKRKGKDDNWIQRFKENKMKMVGQLPSSSMTNFN